MLRVQQAGKKGRDYGVPVEAREVVVLREPKAG